MARKNANFSKLFLFMALSSGLNACAPKGPGGGSPAAPEANSTTTTLAPVPPLKGLDGNGNPVDNGSVTTTTVSGPSGENGGTGGNAGSGGSSGGTIGGGGSGSGSGGKPSGGKPGGSNPTQPNPNPSTLSPSEIIVTLGNDPGSGTNDFFDRGLVNAIFEANVCRVTGHFSGSSRRCYAVFQDKHMEWVTTIHEDIMNAFIADLKLKAKSKPKRDKK